MEGQIEAQRERKVVFEVYVADRAEFETQVAAVLDDEVVLISHPRKHRAGLESNAERAVLRCEMSMEANLH